MILLTSATWSSLPAMKSMILRISLISLVHKKSGAEMEQVIVVDKLINSVIVEINLFAHGRK